MAEQQQGAFSFPTPEFWWGVVEDRTGDPKKLGRVKCRVRGYHTGQQGKIATNDLPWCMLMQDITSAANSGVGRSPTGIVEGSVVWGVFLDGKNAQQPMIMGTIVGYDEGEGFEGGFKDPKGKFPREKGKNGVNRLARNEETDKTILKQKRDPNWLQGGKKAFGGEFGEPKTEYDAKYPYNHVTESESGHIFEVDDTEGKERLHKWHKSGTFEEIYPNGQMVTKVVKDAYTIIMEDDYILVKQNQTTNVKGELNILVEGNAKFEVKGNKQEKIHGNYEMEVGGNYTVKVAGTHSDTAGAHRKIKAPRIDLN